MIDVREIKLNMRYPESRQEDITDAFTRGYTGAIEISNKAIKKLEEENARLRSCLSDDAENARLIMGENEKLRELAATAWWIAENLCQAFDGSCESCPHGERDDRCVYEKIQRDLLDMGVEVAS